MVKKVLITGANFINKGAQSMLFTVTKEIKNRYPYSEVYFACNREEYDEKNYSFKKLLYTMECQSVALDNEEYRRGKIKKGIIDFLRFCLRRSDDFFRLKDARHLFRELDLVIDVSGYALADRIGPAEHEYYLNNIRLAEKYNVPIVLMPQSFGPFEYSDKNRYLLEEIKTLLKYPARIFAREKEGYDLLTEGLELTNVEESTDLVLQSSSQDNRLVLKDSYKPNYLKLTTSGNVGIIPNYHCFEKEERNNVHKLYSEIINQLTSAGKNVYIFRHATLDADICTDLANKHDKNDKVHLIDRDFDCVEFDNLVRQFEFLICSRYHGCVHAYKNGVPCVILGWAVKYRSLADCMGQEKYIFDIVNKADDSEEILNAVCQMADNLDIEKEIIKNNLKKIQESNCFTILDEIDW